MCPRLSANYVSCCPPNMAQVSVWAGNLHCIKRHSVSIRIFDSGSIIFNAVKHDRTILRNCPFSFCQFRHLLRIMSSAVPLFYQTY